MKPSRERRAPRPNLHGRRRRFDATPLVLVIGVFVAGVTVIGAWSVLAGGIDINLDWESFRPSSDDKSPAATGTPGPTTNATPSPTPGLPAVNGSPLSLSTLEAAWKAKGLTLFSEGAAKGFSGQAVSPSAVRARRGAESAVLAVLVYPNGDAIKQDWNLSAGSAPSPTDGRSMPASQSVWWNQNVVVVLISGDAAIAADVKAAFLGL
jgi:hypothetical protein